MLLNHNQGRRGALRRPAAPEGKPIHGRACRWVAYAGKGSAGKGSPVKSASADLPQPRDILAVPLRIVTVGKGNSPGATAMADEWLEKLRRYTKVAEVTVKPNPKKSSSVPVAVAAEGEKVLAALTPGERVILLDERGREVSSGDIARILASAGDQGVPSLAFCIGGPYGHADAVRERADDCIRLSACVLNHQVAYIVLLEQLYRGWAILRGEPYHHV